MASPRRADSFGWEAIEEHCIALVAKSPLILCQVRWWLIVWQHKHESLRLMTAARRAGPFVWEAIEEHCITLVAKSPLILLGHGYNLLQVTGEPSATRPELAVRTALSRGRARAKNSPSFTMDQIKDGLRRSAPADGTLAARPTRRPVASASRDWWQLTKRLEDGF